MFKINSETGAITTFQGDSGSFYIAGDNLLNYNQISFSVYDETHKICMEVCKDYNPETDLDDSNGLNFEIPPSETDKLVVNKDDDYKEFYYSIKMSDTTNDIENTFLIKNHSVDDNVPFIVYAKRNEGEVNG